MTITILLIFLINSNSQSCEVETQDRLISVLNSSLITNSMLSVVVVERIFNPFYVY